MSYQNELKTIEWQQKRLLVYQRDKWRCTNKKCKSPNYQLDIHHLDYIPGIKAWEYPMDMLVTLCRNCHSEEMKRPYLEKYLSTTLKMKGFLMSDLLALSCKIDTDDHFAKTLLTVLREMQNA